jgi:hypothetical protein
LVDRLRLLGPRLLLLVLALLLAPPGVRAAERRCSGKLSGAVKGTFRCTVTATAGPEGRGYLVITPEGPVEGARAFSPGAFELAGPLAAGSYDLASLVAARSSLITDDGALFSATRTTSARGEATLTLRSVEQLGGKTVAGGALRARLLPSGTFKTGEVLVEVEFQ